MASSVSNDHFSLKDKIQKLPILQIINSRFWKAFLSKDDKLVMIGRKIIPLTMVSYFQNMFPDCSKYHLKILERCYTSDQFLSRVYAFLQFSQIGSAVYDKEKTKFVCAFYGAIFSFGQEQTSSLQVGTDLSMVLTTTILDSFEIKLPHISSNKIYLKYLFLKLGLPKPILIKSESCENENGCVQLQLMLAPKAVSFFESLGFDVDTCRDELGHGPNKSKAFSMASTNLESLGITMHWVECYLFSMFLRGSFAPMEIEIIAKRLSLSNIEYFRFVPRFVGESDGGVGLCVPNGKDVRRLYCSIITGYRDGTELLVANQVLRFDALKTWDVQVLEFKYLYLRSFLSLDWG